MKFWRIKMHTPSDEGKRMETNKLTVQHKRVQIGTDDTERGNYVGRQTKKEEMKQEKNKGLS